MDHSHTGPTSKPLVAPVAGGMAGASIGLGFFSMLVFWWYPFTIILATVGLSLGLICLTRGDRGPRGENFPLGGVALCATSLAMTLTLYYGLRFLQWDSFMGFMKWDSLF